MKIITTFTLSLLALPFTAFAQGPATQEIRHPDCILQVDDGLPGDIFRTLHNKGYLMIRSSDARAQHRSVGLHFKYDTANNVSTIQDHTRLVLSSSRAPGLDRDERERNAAIKGLANCKGPNPFTQEIVHPDCILQVDDQLDEEIFSRLDDKGYRLIKQSVTAAQNRSVGLYLRYDKASNLSTIEDQNHLVLSLSSAPTFMWHTPGQWKAWEEATEKVIQELSSCRVLE